MAVDPQKSPQGMKDVADYLHDKELKLGVYTDISSGSCAHAPGSDGHYVIDNVDNWYSKDQIHC